MAITIDGAVSGREASTNTQTQSPKTQTRSFGGSRWGSETRRTFGRQQVGRVIQEYMDTLRAIAQQKEDYAEGRVGYKFLPLDSAESGGNVGSILVARQEQDYVAVVTLLLAKTSVPLQDIETPRQVDSYGNQVGGVSTIPQVVSDFYFKKVFENAARAKVSEAYPGKKVVLLSPMLIPAHVEANNNDALFEALVHAFDACEMYLGHVGVFQTGEIKLTPEQLDPTQNRIHVVANYRRPDETDALGTPIRSSDTIDVQVRRTYRDGDETISETSTIVTTRGYFDAIYIPPEVDNQDRDWTLRNIASFVPAYVITDISVGPEQAGLTLSHLALSIASLSIHAENNNWMSGLNTDKSRPWRDARTLGRQIHKTGTPISADDVTEGEMLGVYTDPDVITFLQYAFFQNRTQTFIDVLEAGVTSGVLAPIGDAANGNPAAIEFFINSWDNFTLGKVSKRWKARGCPPLFKDMDLRIPVGTCDLTNDSGTVDTRHIDNIYMNTNSDVIQDVIELDEVFYGTSCRGELRTEKISRFHRERVTPTYTQYARRYMVTRELMEILVEAILESGYDFRADPNYEVERRVTERGQGREDLANGFGFQNGRSAIYKPATERQSRFGRSWTNRNSVYGK